MRKIFLFLCFLILQPSAGAAQAACGIVDNGTPIRIDIGGECSSYRLRHDLPLQEIRVLEREKEQRQPERTLGFTSYEMKSSFEFAMNFRQAPGEPGGCAWLSDIKALFDVAHINVFIPSEYVPPSCEYRQILAHEEEHVRILEETYREFREVLTRILRADGSATFESTAPLRADSQASAKAQIQGELQRRLDDFMDDFKDTLEKRQATIDTEENYRAIQSRCPGWQL